MFQRRDNGGLDSRRGVEKWVGSRDAQNVKLVTPGDEVCMWRWEASGCNNNRGRYHSLLREHWQGQPRGTVKSVVLDMLRNPSEIAK